MPHTLKQNLDISDGVGSFHIVWVVDLRPQVRDFCQVCPDTDHPQEGFLCEWLWSEEEENYPDIAGQRLVELRVWAEGEGQWFADYSLPSGRTLNTEFTAVSGTVEIPTSGSGPKSVSDLSDVVVRRRGGDTYLSTRGFYLLDSLTVTKG